MLISVDGDSGSCGISTQGPRPHYRSYTLACGKYKGSLRFLYCASSCHCPPCSHELSARGYE